MPRSCRAKQKNNPRGKTFTCDFSKLHHSNPNSFGTNVHLHPNLKKTVKVIERSRDVTPRSEYENWEGHRRSPCASHLVQFQPIFKKLRHFERNGTPLFPLIGHHLESVSRTEPVFEFSLAPSEKRLTYEFRSNSSIFVIELSCEHCKLQPLCHGKGQRSELNIEENTSLGNRSSYFKLVAVNWPPSLMCHSDLTGY